MNYTLTLLISLLLLGCANNTNDSRNNSSYLQSLEEDNNISYTQIRNSRGIYITSMCYTKTQDATTKKVSNPCYSCHTKGKTPNYFNDSTLQKEYNFPDDIAKNPFSNLFKDRSNEVSKISDNAILEYVRQSNYFDENRSIVLNKKLPKDWKGYRPDCHFNFDDEGFDRDDNGKYTLWRAFRYYPFLGTFWPTNGSTDDVLIRLDSVFSQNDAGEFNKEIYTLNLAIVEAISKQKDIALSLHVNESDYGVDLNQNGVLDSSNKIALASFDKMSYVGKAKTLLEKKKVHLSLGLFPVNTEFLHSVRYLDIDTNTQNIVMSKRMKELRYAKKYAFKTYSEIQRVASAELWEAQAQDSAKGTISTYRGDFQTGLDNDLGWKYQGFIEDKKGALRPQTHEETIACMGCHSHLGATTDSIFSFARKFEGVDKAQQDYGWNHWSQKGLVGVKEPQVEYKNQGLKYEYSFYLQNNHSGNEFRNNDEVKEKFFDNNNSIKSTMKDALHNDISLLLLPSKERALALNKAYKVLVQEQSYIYGREGNAAAFENVLEEFDEEENTGIEHVIVVE